MKASMKHKLATAGIAAALLLGSAPFAPAPSAYAAQSAEVVWGVNMRTTPSSSGPIVRMLQKGEAITVLESAGTGWYKVSDSKGATGYISSASKYTQLGATTSSGGTSTGTSGTGTSVGSSDAVASLTGVITKSVSFRKSASTSGQRIRYLQTGEKVSVLSKTNSSWYEVMDSSGVKGYVTTQSQYMTIGGSSNLGSGSTAGSGTSGGSTDGGSSNSGTSNGGSFGSSGSTGASAGSATASASVEKVIAAGMKYLGTPYEYGSDRSNTKTFDCSDFTRQAFKDALGITIPADSRKQGAYVKEKGNAVTDISKLKRGDLMFFMSYKGSSKSAYSGLNKSTQTITHVGIYLGNGQILHTYSKASGGVRTDTITGKHWEYRFLFGGSAL
ncbi:C40 family peptidase [Paenibacillus sp. CAU 1782]